MCAASTDADQAESSNAEFIELLNLSDTPLPLFDPLHPSHVWRLAGAVAFSFPSGTTVPARGRLVVTPFDPVADPAELAAFRAAYAPGIESALVGPYSGRLDNGGESVELYRPDTPQGDLRPDAGFVPLLLVDRVEYSSRDPWPVEAGGDGASLHRRVPEAYGNEPENWMAAKPSPGRAHADLDTDEDGLPDDWETRFGTDPEVPDRLADPDRDGMTNIEEYRTGTDPLSAASVLALESLAIDSDRVTLRFPAAANHSYSVLYADRLGGTHWSELADVPAADSDRWVTVEDLAPSPSGRFYRVLTPAQP